MLFDIEIEVGGEKLTMTNVAVDDNGFFNACACNGEQQKRVDGAWSPTYLVVSVGDGNAGKCGSECKIEVEIAAGHMYVFDQWADEVMLSNRHANFSGASGVMKFSFEDGSDTIEFVDATGPTVVKFKEASKTNTEVVETGAVTTSSEEVTPPKVEPPATQPDTAGSESEEEVKKEEEEEEAAEVVLS